MSVIWSLQASNDTENLIKSGPKFSRKGKVYRYSVSRARLDWHFRDVTSDVCYLSVNCFDGLDVQNNNDVACTETKEAYCNKAERREPHSNVPSVYCSSLQQTKDKNLLPATPASRLVRCQPESVFFGALCSFVSHRQTIGCSSICKR